MIIPTSSREKSFKAGSSSTLHGILRLRPAGRLTSLPVELLFQDWVIPVADQFCLGRFCVFEVSERSYLDVKEFVG